MGKLIKTEALVLRSQPVGEADSLLTLYAPLTGKIRAVARGARKTRSQQSSAVQLLSHTSFLLFSGRSLYTVRQCELLEPFGQIKGDVLRLAYADYLVETLELMVPEGESQPAVFRLTLTCLHLLSNQAAVLVTCYYQLQLLRLLGYRPELECCAGCGLHRGAPGATVSFSPRQGGLVCPRCAGGDPSARSLGAASLALMRHLSNTPPERLRVLRLEPDQLQELAEVLAAYLLERSERLPRAANVIEELKASWPTV